MKHKRAISWLLAVAIMVSNLTIMPVSAANYVLDTPALTAPDFDEATFNSEERAFVANYDKFIAPTESLNLKWENVGAKKYEIWVKGLNGLPDPGDDEAGKIIRHEKTSKTSMTINSDELEEWAGHFVKIALQAQDGDDLSYMGWYYLELDEIREAESYTVKYKKNGGDYAPGSDSTDEDGWFTVSSKIPTRDGYEFLGWSIYKNTDEAEYEPGEDYRIDEDITLYAVWEEEAAQQIKPVLEDFDSDEIRIQVNEKITLTGTISAGGSSGAKLNKVTVKHNKTDTKYYPVSANVNAASFDLSRLSFGRFTEPGEYEMVLYASATNYTVKENDIATFTVIVEEKPTKYSITYNSNGGKSAPASDTTDKNGWFIVSGDEPTRDGYNFLGWTDGRNNSEIKFVPDEEYQISKNTTLYAVWEKETAQQIKPVLEDFDSDEIRIQVNEKITLTGTISAGGSSGAKLNKVTVKHNKTGTTYSPVSANVNAASYDLSRLSFGRFTKPGEYEMVLYASATNYTVKENDIVTFTVIVEEKPTKYSVAYNANGGKSAPTSDTTDKNGWFIVSENEPTRDGYDFLGWTDSRSSSEIKYVPDEEYQINKNVTLYAVWEKETAQQIKPVLEDFDSDEIRIQVGERITLTGTISAGGSSGAKLNKVTVKHNKTGTTYSPVSANVNAASYDLSKLSFGRFTKPGKYEMVLYASATNYTVKENDIVTFTVIVSGKGYDVEYDENGGIGAPESQIKQAGTDLILSKEKPSRPDYQFQGWATTKNGKVKYQPGDAYSDDKALTLYAVWEELPNSPYRDIDNHWGYKYICDVTDLGLMSGISNTEFKPNSPMTRQMFASALASLSKVNKNIESWLKANKIMAGYNNGDMGWDDAITREQMALMLVKYLKAEHQSISGKDVNSYEDHKDISTWASDAVYEIQKSALMTGGTGNRFNPKAKTTRAEAAVILSNLAKLVDSGCHHIFVTESKPITDSGKWRDNGDGKTHSRYEVNYNRYCQLCGRKSSILPVTDSVTQNHDFSNAETSVTYQYVNSSYHQMVTITTKTCLVCPAKKKSETKSEYLTEHVYDGPTGKCLADGCSAKSEKQVETTETSSISGQRYDVYYKFHVNDDKKKSDGVIVVPSGKTNMHIYFGNDPENLMHPTVNREYTYEVFGGDTSVLSVTPNGFNIGVVKAGCTTLLIKKDGAIVARTDIAIGDNYIYGCQLGYKKTSDLYYRGVPYTAKAKSAFKDSRMSTEMKQLWFELNLGIYKVPSFEFETYKYDKVAKFARDWFIFSEDITGNLWDAFTGTLDNAIEGYDWLMTSTEMNNWDGLARSDKLSMAKVIVDGWLEEIESGTLIVSDLKLLSALNRYESQLLKLDSDASPTEVIKVLKEAYGFFDKYAEEFLEINPYVGTLVTITDSILTSQSIFTKSTKHELLLAIERCKAKMVVNCLQQKALMEGLDKDIREAVEVLLNNASNVWLNGCENALVIADEITGAIIGAVAGGGLTIATSGLSVAAQMAYNGLVTTSMGLMTGKSNEAWKKYLLETDTYAKTMEGALKIYLTRTKPQLEDALRTYKDNPTWNNYYVINNSNYSGKLQMWGMQSKQLSKVFYTIHNLNVGDENAYAGSMKRDKENVYDFLLEVTHGLWVSD